MEIQQGCITPQLMELNEAEKERDVAEKAYQDALEAYIEARIKYYAVLERYMK